MSALPTLSSPPPPPSRSDDSANFVIKADAFVGWYPTHVAEMNEALAAIPVLAAAVNYNTSSASSLPISVGSTTFTTPVGGILQIGQFVIAASQADPTNYMTGQVISNDSDTGQLIVDVQGTGGSGTHSDWLIAVTVADDLSPVSPLAISGSGADLVAASVTFSKISNASANSKLIGSGAAGSGASYVEITLGANLSMTGTTLNVSSGTATLGNGDYGDITVSGSGTVMTIDAAAVSYAKIQNVSATDKLLGRSTAGAGVIEEISCTPVARTLIAQTTQALLRSTGLGLGTIATFDEATTAQFRANTSGKALSTDKVWAAAGFVALIQAATIAVDLSAGINFTTTMTGNRALGAPTNAKAGQSGTIEIIQDATGSRTLSYNSVWKFEAGISPVLSTTASAKDYLDYQVIDSTHIRASLSKGWA